MMNTTTSRAVASRPGIVSRRNIPAEQSFLTFKMKCGRCGGSPIHRIVRAGYPTENQCPYCGHDADRKREQPQRHTVASEAAGPHR